MASPWKGALLGAVALGSLMRGSPMTAELRAPRYGPERVANGTFDSTTTGWTAGNGATLSAVGGRLRVIAPTPTQFGPLAYQVVAGLTVGKTYRVTAASFPGTAGSSYIRVGTSLAGSQYGTSAANSNMDITFVATQVSAYISLQTYTTPTAGSYNEYDNVSLVEVL